MKSKLEPCQKFVKRFTGTRWLSHYSACFALVNSLKKIYHGLIEISSSVYGIYGNIET